MAATSVTWSRWASIRKHCTIRNAIVNRGRRNLWGRLIRHAQPCDRFCSADVIRLAMTLFKMFTAMLKLNCSAQGNDWTTLFTWVIADKYDQH